MKVKNCKANTKKILGNLFFFFYISINRYLESRCSNHKTYITFKKYILRKEQRTVSNTIIRKSNKHNYFIYNIIDIITFYLCQCFFCINFV